MMILSQQNNKRSHSHYQTGFSLVEVLIACSIISLSIFSLMSASAKGIELSNQALKQTQANLLLEEGAEAVKSIRDTNVAGTDSGWANITGPSLDTIYYLTFNTNTNAWSLGITPTPTIDSLFTRTVIFGAVNRDSNDDIASSGTLDTKTRKVNVLVSWPGPDTTILQKSIDFYISDIFD